METMHHFKLTYFNARGRAEISRLILAFAEVEYEDERVSLQQWLELKPNAPQGHVPYLTIDGTTTLSQSLAIARYLAREYDLEGGTSLEKAMCDSITQTTADVMNLYIAFYMEKDSTRKEALEKKFNEEELPKYRDIFEQMLVDKADDGDDFFVGKSLTIADLAVYDLFEIPLKNIPELFFNSPKLAAHRKRVEELPKIKEYLEKRPQTTF